MNIIMKRLLFISGILFTNSIIVNAQNEKNGNNLQYTIDKQIPSYVEITDRGVSSPERTVLKARHFDLEKLLNLNGETNAILKDTLTDIAGGFHESCMEYYHGIEVEGTRFTIHYNKDGLPTMANGNFRTINNLKTVPSISESEALQSAIKYVGAEKYNWEDGEDCPEGKLVVFVKEEDSYLAYKFVIHAIVPYSNQFVYINADNGGFLESYSAEYPISSSVQTRYSDIVNIETLYSNGVYKLRDYTRGSGIETYNYYLMQDYLSTDNTWTNMSTFDRSALDVHWGAEKTYDFYYYTFGRNSYNNCGGKIISRVNDMNYGNASWETNANRMHYGFYKDIYGIIHLDSPLVALDIVAHELTHGVTQATSGLVYQGESGALNEGMSDVFAVCIENATKPLNGNNIWLIGEDVETLRDLSTPTCKYYHGIGWINVNDEYDHGGVHYNSGVFSYWFYLISMGGPGTNQSNLNYPVQGIGLDNAIQICYLMNTSYLSPDATYDDARRCSYMAAQALGYSSNVIDQLRKAWIDVGVESPNLTINGNSIICNSASYYVDGLPSGYSITWSFKNASSLNSLIQQTPFLLIHV